MDVGVRLEELPNATCLMSREVVSDDVDLLAARLTGHHVHQEGDELLARVPFNSPAQYLTRPSIQGRIQRERAVPVVLETMTFRPESLGWFRSSRHPKPSAPSARAARHQHAAYGTECGTPTPGAVPP